MARAARLRIMKEKREKGKDCPRVKRMSFLYIYVNTLLQGIQRRQGLTYLEKNCQITTILFFRT